MIRIADQDLRPLPFSNRHEAAVETVQRIQSPTAITAIPLITGADEKRELFNVYRDTNQEGVVLKALDAPYSIGKAASGGPARKFKFVETATFIVLRHNDKRSIGLGLLDTCGNLVDVGNCTVPANVEPESVPQDGHVEVRYLYAYAGGCVIQPVFVGVRTDIDRSECVLAQLKFKAEV